MPLSRYLSMLEESGQNLLVFRDGEVIFSSDGRGVKPLVEAIEGFGREGLVGVVTADRVVGRAAALLNVYMGAREVHALIMSSAAKGVLADHGLVFEFHVETEAIKTRDGVVFCPFERLVWGVSDPEDAYLRIRAKLGEL
jgi:hypothetical protein